MSYRIKDILHSEVIPALGCTEPAAVALCAAAAVTLLPIKDLSSLELWVSPNIYKNAMGVAIPGTHGEFGIDLAAVLGAFGGDPYLKLEVFKPINDQTLMLAKDFLQKRNVHVHLLETEDPVFIKVQVQSGCDQAQAIVADAHDHICGLQFNGDSIHDHPLLSTGDHPKESLRHLEQWISGLSLEEMVGLLDDLDGEDLQFIEEGIRYNMALARHGLKYGPGLGIGMTLERLVSEGLLKKDMILAARILTSAASDARMSGVNLPAMSSAGSGNHGLTAVLPIRALIDYISCEDPLRMLRAIALSHILTAYIKAHIGRLSAICGCSIAAGAGATGGIAYLMNGNTHHIAGAIKNLIEDLAGVICDGAKAGCSLKLATAAGTAVQSALFALHGIDVKPTDGIIASTSEQTMKNIGELSTRGMAETDRTILRIMITKHFETRNLNESGTIPAAV
ncbi:MAG TPA: L-serine ammonia-lyase, iron-sulfur-dependent, subunit alpha [Desulfomonilaceae bacterium]|nr:L-serine ammonia-lyase, iron-sulfur-dependent, subunit alpha [Desulfomonilaceae bacterium]